MEIERKFLVDQELWKQVDKGTGKHIQQGYFTSNEHFSVRVRTKGERAFLTVKGTREGISRDEFEYEIPYADADFMLRHYTQPFLEKTRYEVVIAGKTWEIDEFHGKLSPLILAEIELESETEPIELPSWVTQEVSTDPDYFNSNIIKRLFD
ncbi:CYTH domain-containing protein [Crocinitomicaceae bacterium CZZ-1]|uniref:CYTH domain-containing protein n=1 Tax=Taishania pollutisoli TaxID=2766479 RepID=A0A8J6P7E0_9FLAO|nr:CYTH domain-containing protein [Taishania pollutisoli]MBC9813202.1 CYTH domain-containing protein [Taishania pollutisoli]